MTTGYKPGGHSSCRGSLSRLTWGCLMGGLGEAIRSGPISATTCIRLAQQLLVALQLLLALQLLVGWALGLALICLGQDRGKQSSPLFC